MAVTQLKQKFGERLRRYIQKTPVTQKDIADMLDVTASAVSQILSGRIVPNHGQLTAICRKLELDGNATTELVSMLARIRNGERDLRSPFNTLLYACRCEKNMDVNQLAKKTGIEVSRLQNLESCFGVTPTLAEVNQLAQALNCAPEEFLVSAGMGEPKVSGNTVTLGEIKEEFKTPENLLPLLKLEDLKEMRSSDESIFGFAARKASGQTAAGAGLDVPAVALVCRGNELQLGAEGEVLLIVTAERAAGYREIELCLGSKGKFFIRERNQNAWWTYRLVHHDGQEEHFGNAVITLPVLEMVFRPLKKGISKERI